jgi:thioredoxin:protein disulfide reductase
MYLPMHFPLNRLLMFLLALGLHGLASAQELLPPEVAFKFSAQALNADTLEVRYSIADGYYLYRNKFKFAAAPGSIELGEAQFPPGNVHDDEYFGKVETYRREVRIRLPYRHEKSTTDVKLSVTSQGCADAGVCYVPQTQTASVALPPPDAALRLSAPATDAPLAGVGAGEEARFARLLSSGSLWLITAAFFGAGILLAFTPCLLPMIPILSGIIVGDGGNTTRTRAFALSCAYVLGMSATYVGIGIGAALSGHLLSAALQDPWLLSTFAAVFVLLSLSMFGFYDLQLPSRLHEDLAKASNCLKGGRLGAVVLMGMLSTAIVSPCVAAPLAGALLYVSQTRDVTLGGTALFALSMGMGIPLILVGVFEGAILPKSGRWMRSVKHFFGVLLLAVAIWIVSPVLPVAVRMLAWAALLIGSAMVLRAIDPLLPEAGYHARLWKGLGFLGLLMGTALAIGAFAGSQDVLRPLAGILAGGEHETGKVRFTRVADLAELEAKLQNPGAPVMLDFYADWCVSCREMEGLTFTDARVKAKMSQMLLLQADVTANSAADKALLKRFSLFGPPGIIFFDRQGRNLDGMRVVGYQTADIFLDRLERATGL